jgi:hypothetical protein
MTINNQKKITRDSINNNEITQTKMTITLTTKNNKFVIDPADLDKFNETFHDMFLGVINEYVDPASYDPEFRNSNSAWHIYKETLGHLKWCYTFPKTRPLEYPTLQSLYEDFKIDVKIEKENGSSKRRSKKR